MLRCRGTLSHVWHGLAVQTNATCCMQYLPTLLRATCCIVWTPCCMKFEPNQTSCNIIQHRATGCSNDATSCVQQRWTMLHTTCCVRLNGPLVSFVQHANVHMIHSGAAFNATSLWGNRRQCWPTWQGDLYLSLRYTKVWLTSFFISSTGLQQCCYPGNRAAAIEAACVVHPAST